jgi:SPP1 family predicted phage head-tail adaptor
VAIRRLTETPNGKGGYNSAWTDVDTVWAEVIGLKGGEQVLSQALQGVTVYRVTIRWRGDVQEKDELRSTGPCFGGKAVNIRSAVDPTGGREELVITGDTAAARS